MEIIVGFVSLLFWIILLIEVRGMFKETYKIRKMIEDTFHEDVSLGRIHSTLMRIEKRLNQINK